MACPEQVRVLVVDDSVVMRRIVARTLERNPSIDLTDFAANGALALEKIAERRPDLVVLDLEMPVMDGFATLEAIRRTDPWLPVVLFSSVDKRIATATLDALSLGATDFIVKPVVAGIAEAEAYVAEHLVPLILALSAPRPTHLPSRTRSSPPPSKDGPVEAVVVATSTGGPDALARLVAALPAHLPVPVLVVQHMPPMFTRLLSERLHRLGRLSVREAEEGDVVASATVYVAPGDRHLKVVRVAGQVRVLLDDGPPENSCRPAADVLLRSAVDVYGGRVLAVILTGMGHDGLSGCRCVRESGGQVIVQDPTTALIASMPRSVQEAGLAQAALPLDLLADDLVRRVGRRITG